MSPRKNFGEGILNAAEEVVLDVGAGHMTLDAVSARAGVSKGGLLYHFPSKEALIHAMIKRLIDSFEAARVRELAKLPQSPSRELKAHIISFSTHNRRMRRLIAGLLAAVAHDPKLLGPAKKAIDEALAKFAASGLSRERAMAVSLAVDGMLFMEVLGFFRFTPKQRKAIIKELLRFVDA